MLATKTELNKMEHKIEQAILSVNTYFNTSKGIASIFSEASQLLVKSK